MLDLVLSRHHQLGCDHVFIQVNDINLVLNGIHKFFSSYLGHWFYLGHLLCCTLFLDQHCLLLNEVLLIDTSQWSWWYQSIRKLFLDEITSLLKSFTSHLFEDILSNSVFLDLLLDDDWFEVSHWSYASSLSLGVSRVNGLTRWLYG